MVQLATHLTTSSLTVTTLAVFSLVFNLFLDALSSLLKRKLHCMVLFFFICRKFPAIFNQKYI